MDFEKITGFTDRGTFCVWCSYHYPQSFFRQSIDVCQPCEDFRFKHHYDLGKFYIAQVNEIKFRIFQRYDSDLNDFQVRQIIEKSI